MRCRPPARLTAPHDLSCREQTLVRVTLRRQSSPGERRCAGRETRRVELGTWARRVPPSGIREIVNLAMSRPDADIVRLEVGQPDLPIEPHIVTAAQEAATLGVGLHAELRHRPIARGDRRTPAARRRSVATPPTRSSSAKAAGRRSPSPSPPCSTPATRCCCPIRRGRTTPCRRCCAAPSVVPYALHASNGYLPDLDQMRALITDRTRVIVINSPSNPTGAVFPAELVAAIVELAAEHDLWVLSDEVYDEIVFDGEAANAAQLRPRPRRRHLQLLQDVLDDGLAGRLRGVPATAGPTPRHAPGTDAVVHLRGQPVRRPRRAAKDRRTASPASCEIYRCPARPRRHAARRRRLRRRAPGWRLLPDGPAGAGNRQPASGARPRRARRRHGAGERLRRRSPRISCGCRSPHRRRRCARGHRPTAWPGRTRRRPGRR